MRYPHPHPQPVCYVCSYDSKSISTHKCSKTDIYRDKSCDYILDFSLPPSCIFNTDDSAETRKIKVRKANIRLHEQPKNILDSTQLDKYCKLTSFHQSAR